jgi:hypothetical protein
MRDNIHTLINILAHSEEAMNLAQFQRQSEIDTKELTEALDMLVQIRIFQSDVSYHASDIGEVVYMFADNAEAQRAYKIAIGDEGAGND